MTPRQFHILRIVLIVVAVGLLLVAVLISRANGEPTPPEQAPTTTVVGATPATTCSPAGGCILDESTPFSVVRPVPQTTPATVCTPAGGCVLGESTPFSVVR